MKVLNQHKFKIYFNQRSFEKYPKKDIIDYDFNISINHIERSFSEFYNNQMVTERDCFDFEDDYEDFYIALHELNFPDLSEILDKNRHLFLLFTQEHLKYDFFY